MRYILFIILLGIRFFAIAQITFEKTYHDTDYVLGSDIIQLNDSGYLVVGNILDDKSLYRYPKQYALRIDKNGNTLWKQAYNSPVLGWYPKVKKLNNDELAILACESGSIDFSDEPSIRRIDLSGNEKYYKLFEELLHFNIEKILITSDTCWLLAGYQTSIVGHLGVILSKINWKGDTIWTKKFVSPNYINMMNPIRYNIIEFNDSCFTVVENDSSNKVFITKLTYNKDTIWSKKLQIEYTGSQETPLDLLFLSDSTIILSSSSKNDFFKLYKFGKNGLPIWKKTFPVKSSVKIVDVKHNVFLAYGRENYYTGRALVVFFDTSGNIVSQKKYGDNPGEFLSMYKTLENGYIFTGYSKNAVYLVKTDSLGNVAKPANPVTVNIVKESTNFVIYPNPNNGNFQIIFPGNHKWRFDIRITDITGKEIFTKKDCTDNTDISIQNYKSGIYYITVTNQEYSSTQKIIVD